MSRLVGLTLFALGCGSDSDPEQSAGPSCDLQVDAGDNVAAVLGTTVHLAASSECTGRDPTINRADPDPAPHRSSAAWAAATTSGCWVRPR